MVSAIKPVRVNVTANQTYIASFSLNADEFSTRTHIVPDRIYFNATGTAEASSIPEIYTTPYSPWPENYTARPWSFVTQKNTTPALYLVAMQISQQPSGSTMLSGPETIFLTKQRYSDYQIVLNSYPNAAALFSASPEIEISDASDTVLPLTHAMVLSKRRAYFFWLVAGNKIKVRTFDGNTFSGIFDFATGVNLSYGLSGCIIDSGTKEYVALTYAKSTTEVNIVTFEDTAAVSYSSSVFTANLGVVDSRQVAINQNPRTEKVILSWINSEKGFCRTYDFAAAGNFTNESVTTGFSSSLEKLQGVNAVGLENFENSLALPKRLATSNNIENSLLRGSSVTFHDLIAPTGYATQFFYTSDGQKYLGMVILSGFTKFDFHRRLLNFPSQSAWDKNSKTLHIEGPPWPNTLVGAEVDFGEVATTTSLAHATNSAGGRQPLDGLTGVIASASTLYTVKFDRNMQIGDYASLIADNKVKLLAPGNLPVPINYVAGNSGPKDFSFRSAVDLAFNTPYKITLASSVIDANGSQIYAAATMNFTTQSTSASVLASEVINIFAYSDAARLNSIASGGEILANSIVYLRMEAVDPAFNTIDTATVSVWRNGSQVALVNMTQIAANSTDFYGQYNVSAPLSEDSVYEFRTPAPTKYRPVIVTFPSFSPLSPVAGATDIPISSTIKIKASENISSAEINAITVSLKLVGIDVPAGRAYNPGTQEITITPDAALQSEKTYVVAVSGLKDVLGNPQTVSLTYQFTIEDVTPPTIVLPTSPANTESGVTIDRPLIINFSEAILSSSATPSTIKLLRGGVPASYSVNVSGNQVIIYPDDAPGGLRTQTTYTLQLGNAVKDLAGNGLANVPATFSMTFLTQPTVTAPSLISSLTLYKDSMLIDGWGTYERLPASATIYMKVTGTDGATQTRDIATVTLSLSWGGNYTIPLSETASNSGGYYIGNFDLDTIPLYGIPSPPGPLPPTPIGSLTFAVQQTPAQAATLTVSFPQQLTAQTTVNSLGGTVTANGATAVRIDSPIKMVFSDKLVNAGDATNLSISSGTTLISGIRSLSAGQTDLTFTPATSLPFSSIISVNGVYGSDGLKSPQGNPIYRPFNFSFTTQASQTPPLAATQVILFPDAAYSPLSAYTLNQDLPQTGTIYIEVRAPDASPLTLDYTNVSVTTGATVKLDETAINSGVYRGFHTYSALPDGFIFKVLSTVTATASQTLRLSLPAVTPLQPASAAANVSIATRVTVKVSEELRASSVNSTNIKLFKGASEIVGSIVYKVADNEIEFTPASNLSVSSAYFFKVSGLKDLAGNNQPAALNFSFTTQAATTAPVTINSLRIYPDNTYTTGTHLADLALTKQSGQVYVQIEATDLSNTTIDSTVAEMTSNQTALVTPFTLIETGLNTGVFRGAATIYPEEDIEVTIRSQTTPSIRTRLKTYELPRIDSLSPASATNNIYLDTIFTINTKKDVAAATLSTATILLADSSGLASYVVSLESPRVIKIHSELQPAAPVTLKITTGLKDTHGLAFAEIAATYSTMTPFYGPFKLYLDAGFNAQLPGSAKVEAGQTIYAKLTGSDAWYYRAETASTNVCTSISSFTFLLNELSPGNFTGSFVVPDEAGQFMSVIPKNIAVLEQTLEILPAFALLSYSPASGAMAVPADSWPTWNFSRTIKATDVTLANFKLLRAFDLAIIPGSLSISPSGKQVRFQPNSLLSLLTQYEMSVSQTVRDNAGHTLGTNVTTRFTTQPPPLPPDNLSSLKNFESNNYATSTFAVANNGTLYLELVAADTSFSTYDTARVRVDSSDGTLDGLELTLIEISPPSGIYRYALPINLAPGVSIRVRSQADPTFFMDITANVRTQLLGVAPASGSAELFLDSPISLTFSQAIDRATTGNGLSITASMAEQIPLAFSFSNSDRTLQVLPQVSYATASRHLLKIHTNLRDTNGLFLLPAGAYYTTRNAGPGSLDILTGIAPRDGQSVTLTHEATRNTATIIATTTNLFTSYPESRLVRLTTATQSFDVNLSEIAPGSFKGTFDFTATMPTSFNSRLLHANQPMLAFTLADSPALLSIDPASGSSNIAELPNIVATFSRKMAFNSANSALTISSANSTVAATPVAPGADSPRIAWQITAPLPQQASCTLKISGITDYLGQPLEFYQHGFSTGGRQGINLYRDNSFAQLIATNQIEIPSAFVEVAASGSTNLSGRIFTITARTGTRASETINLPLQPVNALSGRFRCKIEFDPTRTPPEYFLPLLPGEWVEFTAPELTTDQKLFYYKYSGSVSPTRIDAIRFYAEKHFAQRIVEQLANPTLFIEAIAEDLNWLTVDTTPVRVSSEADPIGFILNLQENGSHAANFQNFVRISKIGSDAANQTLKVLPAQKITVESVTNPTIRESILYLPENGIRVVAVFPSPARGDNVNFRFYLNFPTDVDLEIFDSAGDEVYSTVIRGLEGENLFKWQLPRRLANGVYFYRLRIGNDTNYPSAKRKARGKFAVLR